VVRRRRVAILGATGSIGSAAIRVIAAHPDRFELVALGAGRRVAELLELVRRFAVPLCAVADEADAVTLRETLGSDARVVAGAAGLHAVAAESGADVLLAATDGMVACDAVFAALASGIDLAIANKELVVAAGELLMATATRSGARIVPVDSEHSAIFQSLVGESTERIARVILTASGGPFRTLPLAEFAHVRYEDALRHPTWSMGVKNSIDSATMMNKGLELIEASRLFALPAERLDVVIHPTSVVHGFVLFTDGNIKAQLAAPDMALPIGYALAYPDRLVESDLDARLADPLMALGGARGADRVAHVYERVDPQRFPAVGLALRALRMGGTAPTMLSAANEVAITAFQQGELSFLGISQAVAAVLDMLPVEHLDRDTLFSADRAARAAAHAWIARGFTCSIPSLS